MEVIVAGYRSSVEGFLLVHDKVQFRERESSKGRDVEKVRLTSTLYHISGNRRVFIYLSSSSAAIRLLAQIRLFV